MRESLYDRCLTLEIQRDPWLNGIRTNQCNHEGAWGKCGQRDTVCVPALQELLAMLEHQFCFCFCMAWQTADWPHKRYIALRFSQMPKLESRQKRPETWPQWAHIKRVCMFRVRSLKGPMLFSGRSEISCRAYLKSTHSAYHILKRASLFLCSHWVQLLLFFAILSLHLSELLACEWSLKWSICPWIPMYQPVSVCIDLVGIGPNTEPFGQIPFMDVHSIPGLNPCGISGCRLNTYCNLHALLYTSQLNELLVTSSALECACACESNLLQFYSRACEINAFTGKYCIAREWHILLEIC